MLSFKLLEEKTLKRLVIGLFLLDLFTIITMKIEAFLSNQLETSLLIGLVGINFIGLILGILLVEKQVQDLSKRIAESTNGSHKPPMHHYSDQGLCGLEYQFANLSERLWTQNERLQKEKENQIGLITDLSHQLKTPLSSVKIFYTLLSEDRTQNNREAVMQKMGEEIDKLDWLGSMLLEIAKLESGMIQLNPEPCNLGQLVREVVSSLYVQAREKAITIEGHMDEDIALSLDKKWTKEALYNVLDNAIKYTDSQGTIGVRVEDSGVAYEVHIKDTGIGIPVEDRVKIFQRFKKGSNALQEKGSGVGLYLSKEILRMEEATIRCQSVLGQGTTFVVAFHHD